MKFQLNLLEVHQKITTDFPSSPEADKTVPSSNSAPITRTDTQTPPNPSVVPLSPTPKGLAQLQIILKD